MYTSYNKTIYTDSRFQTIQTSATLPFRTEIAPIEVDANHREMVKFTSATEAKHLITEIVNMIKRKLGLPTQEPGDGDPLAIVNFPEIPDQIIEEDKNAEFEQLARFDTVFVIDDTGSMQLPVSLSETSTPDCKSRWDVLTKSLQFIANIAGEYDKDGIDIHFLISSHLDRTNVASGQEALNLLAEVDLEQGVGGSYFEPILAEILGPYVANYEEFYDLSKKRMKATQPKPLNIIVLTDGQDDEEDATEDLLVGIAKQLNEFNAPRHQVRIQFLQVGDDPEATEYLKRLNNDLEHIHGIRDVSALYKFPMKLITN